MEISVSREGNLVRFEVGGVIDERGAEDIKRRFGELDASSFTDLVFDFGRVSHIGSAGIGKLLLFYKNLALRGGNISIENTSSTVFDLLRVLKLDTLFTISKA
jgi:anti-anti-sigma factor